MFRQNMMPMNMNMNMNMNMGMMNNNININQAQNINNANQLQRPIINNIQISNINNTTLINASLQALSCLKYINIWINMWNNNKMILFNNQNLKTTKELFIVYSALYTKQFPDSSNFILNFTNKVKSYYKGAIDNPINFLYYLLKIIHVENNYPQNPNQNMDILNNLQIQQKVDDQYVKNLFMNLLSKTQKSIISTYFYTILRRQFKCTVCPNAQITYAYEYKYMLKFYINDYYKYRNQSRPEKIQSKLSLDECFDCFTGGYKYQCKQCGNNSADCYYSIHSFSKILIIGLIRSNHTYLNDLDFPNNLDINPYCTSGIYPGMKYTLKACVSLNIEKNYYADVLLGNYWYRFYQNQCNMLGNVGVEIKMFEPQILMYELSEYNNNNISNSQLNQMQQVNPCFGGNNMMNMKFNMMMPGAVFQGFK